MNTILIVAAHPDDEVLGIGGTIAKHVFKGDLVYTLILGEGKTARQESRNSDNKKEELENLQKEALDANKILGVKKVFFESLADNRFDSYQLLDVVKLVEKHIQKLRPCVVYTHHNGDLNKDHRVTFKAVLTACRALPNHSVKKIITFETLSSSEWNHENERFVPNLYSDITDFIDLKLKSISCYKSELRDYPHPRSKEGIEILAKSRGLECSLKYAEGLRIIRSIE